MKKITIILAVVFLSMSVIGSEIFTKDHNGNYGLDKFYINKAMPIKLDLNPKHILECKSEFEESAIENKDFFKEPFIVATHNFTRNIIEISTIITRTGKDIISTYEMLKTEAIKTYELNGSDYHEYDNMLTSDLYEFHDIGFYFLKNKTAVVIHYNYLIEKGKKLNDTDNDYKLEIKIKKED